MNCYCKGMSPTTVMESVTSIFTESQGVSAIKKGGLKSLVNFNFSKHIMFYVIFMFVALLIIGIVYGFFKDRVDLKYWSGVDFENGRVNDGKKDVFYNVKLKAR